MRFDRINLSIKRTNIVEEAILFLSNLHPLRERLEKDQRQRKLHVVKCLSCHGKELPHGLAWRWVKTRSIS